MQSRPITKNFCFLHVHPVLSHDLLSRTHVPWSGDEATWDLDHSAYDFPVVMWKAVLRMNHRTHTLPPNSQLLSFVFGIRLLPVSRSTAAKRVLSISASRRSTDALNSDRTDVIVIKVPEWHNEWSFFLCELIDPKSSAIVGLLCSA